MLPSFALYLRWKLRQEANWFAVPERSGVGRDSSVAEPRGKSEKSEVSRGKWVLWERGDKRRVIVKAEGAVGRNRTWLLS